MIKNTKIEFCCGRKKCPYIEYNKETNKVILGDSKGIEGATTWELEQFKDFVKAVRKGKFDRLFK